MCGIFLSAFILMVLVKIVAKEDAEPEFWPMAAVVLVVTVASFAGQFLLGPFGGLAGIVVLPPALVYVCDVSMKQAIIVTALYIVVNVGLLLAIAGFTTV